MTEPEVSPRRRDRAAFRLGLCLAFFLLALAVVLMRLVYLEWTLGEAFRSHDPRPASKPADVPEWLAPTTRGPILASDGTPLAVTRRREVLAVWYPRLEVGLPEATVRAICRWQGISVAQWQSRREAILRKVERIAESVNRRRDRSKYPRPITVAEARRWHAVLEKPRPELREAVRDDPSRYPGVAIASLPHRVYPQKKVAAHVVGHLGAPRTGPPDRRVGRSGLEAACDGWLRTEPEHERSDVRTTIDPNWQRIAQEILRRYVSPASGGALVVIDLQDDALRVLASDPSYDPNVFESGDAEAIEALLDDPRKPLFCRATMASLPIGSVMKPVIAVALLEEETIEPETLFYCRGYLENPEALRCERFLATGTGHGDVTCGDALCESCNVFFFHFVSRWSSDEVFHRYASQFGFGRPIGLGLAEAAGYLPEKGDVRQLAIGQGAFEATPLQVARMIGMVATGREVRPHLLVSRENGSDRLQLAEIDRETWKVVRGGLRRAVDDRLGTASAALGDLPISPAGKTGTAEVAGKRSHAWFAGYWPAETPRYAMVVLLEHGGSAKVSACGASRAFLEAIARSDR
jgi:penicillin-binding protein 2